MEKAVGTALLRGILREYGRVNQPKLIRDAATKRKVLQMLESATRGIDRLDAVTKRLDPDTVKRLLDKLQVPPLNEIADIKILQKRCPRTRRTRWSNPATHSLKKHKSTSGRNDVAQRWPPQTWIFSIAYRIGLKYRKSPESLLS